MPVFFFTWSIAIKAQVVNDKSGRTGELDSASYTVITRREISKYHT